ncbi:unnamed protein product [Spirodela intermedia]|uniref:DUF7046 domain-containing protein n=1 Tax=Spirodela intermedia TaxID=51605 RepID=A0A7I8KWY6_SPIIN|nr:unnamed protein product [Spirodela intermedia]
MGAYDSNKNKEISYGREVRSPWSGAGDGVGNLTERIGSMGIGDSPMDGLIQVIRAVEDAENQIKQQLEENNKLRDELKQKTCELEKYKSDAITSVRSSSGATRDNHLQESSMTNLSSLPFGNGDDRMRWMDNGSSSKQQGKQQGTIIIDHNRTDSHEDPFLQINVVKHYLSDNKANGNTKIFPGSQTGVDNAVASQFSSPSSRSISPSRHQKEGDSASRLHSFAHGLMQMTEINVSSNLLKQVKEHEEEISQLRRHLADFSMKEAQIRNEKYVLEKRIAHMRLAFDQQQQDLVDAASKALSYRQEIIEENIRLTYALQAAQQEKSTFVSSLMPLLAEYNFQPSVPDAMAITSNLKVLFKHLQEKLLIAEEKLKDSQYQLTPWQADAMNSVPQSPLHPINPVTAAPSKSGLELVPQHQYSHAQSPTASPLNAEIRADWDGLGHGPIRSGSSGIVRRNGEHETMNMSFAFPAFMILCCYHCDGLLFSSKNRDAPISNEAEDSDAARVHPGREPSAHWAGTGNSPYLPSGVDETTPSYHYLPPVLEEPSSSLSEAAEDDPLPAVEGVQITGEAFPGNQLLTSGFSINGTNSCNFEWVRYREDGSINYIEGAMQPGYLVTADDIDCLLAIEIQPLDDRKRKGELVTVFANEQRKITCDPEMQEKIERTYHNGQISFAVSLSAGALNIWENAVLAIKREGYSIKASGTRGVVVAEKFSPNTQVAIPPGYVTEFSIQNSSGVEHMLKASDSRQRDMIVLTMRLFIKGVVEKKRGKKKVLFFYGVYVAESGASPRAVISSTNSSASVRQSQPQNPSISRLNACESGSYPSSKNRPNKLLAAFGLLPSHRAAIRVLYKASNFPPRLYPSQRARKVNPSGFRPL